MTRNRTTRATAGPRGSTGWLFAVAGRRGRAGRRRTSETSPTTWMSASGAAARKSAAVSRRRSLSAPPVGETTGTLTANSESCLPATLTR